ncbi:MAG: multidrug ABC transporter ATP-binding protein [Lysobacteraceae bacterium]|nr:MAG: multidrug ABC transporter ATP-binding protein [Xanthomonadaceae bacterium]
MEPVLRLRGVRKAFGARAALDGLDLEVGAGEWLALLGPNGAGKTTLVRAIAGRVRPDAGTLELLGVDLSTPAAPAARRRLGIVPQDIALLPLLTARENLLHFGQLAGLAGKPLGERVDAALDWTGLGERADEVVRDFSGGMKRRLNIACSVLHEPEVVLLDEPTVGVDPQSRQRIWDMLEGLRRRGATLVLTTHQLDEAQQVADRIAIVDHGRTLAEGRFEDLLQRTVGRARRVRIHCASPLSAVPEGFEGEIGGRVLAATMEDVVTELPALLARLREAGIAATDLSVHTPTLQEVFLHLTGRELRE